MLHADPAFLDDRQDFLSSSLSGDLEDEQLMMMQQQQQQLRPPTSSSSRLYQHQQLRAQVFWIEHEKDLTLAKRSE